MDFESATPSVVKSIKQRDLLNTWIRLHLRDQRLPRLADSHRRESRMKLPTSSVMSSTPDMNRHA